MNHHSIVETDRRHQNRALMLTRDKPIGDLLTGWAVSGIEMARAWFWLSCGTVGTSCMMQRENAKKGKSRPRVPRHAGGADQPVVAKRGLQWIRSEGVGLAS